MILHMFVRKTEHEIRKELEKLDLIFCQNLTDYIHTRVFSGRQQKEG